MPFEVLENDDLRNDYDGENLNKMNDLEHPPDGIVIVVRAG